MIKENEVSRFFLDLINWDRRSVRYLMQKRKSSEKQFMDAS